jgi:hypothetical protein
MQPKTKTVAHSVLALALVQQLDGPKASWAVLTVINQRVIATACASSVQS